MVQPNDEQSRGLAGWLQSVQCCHVLSGTVPSVRNADWNVSVVVSAWTNGDWVGDWAVTPVKPWLCQRTATSYRGGSDRPGVGYAHGNPDSSHTHHPAFRCTGRDCCFLCHVSAGV